ncbi:DUF4291 family protein [Caballeronia sp. GAWG1-1]|uniref:DUF4291 family protein n=1 Tax=Caballeronia sp. GAWG1-1 TaxID=2921742 RepID=UPI0032EB42EF
MSASRTHAKFKALAIAPSIAKIRAVRDYRIIRVYQAYSDAIADTALAEGTFVSPPLINDSQRSK